MNNGYISLHRKMLDNPISKKPHWAWLWVYLLMRANWEDTSIILNGEQVVITKGSFVTGRNSLAKETGIPASTIEDILKYLETQQQIRQQKNNRYRVITIINWEKYQKPDNKSDNKATTSRQLADTDNNINKNNKNNKERVANNHKEDIRLFFEKGPKYYELLDLFSKDRDRGQIESEFDKFILYWSESNGVKQRWQLQEVFDVKRRLFTWMSKMNGFTTKRETKIL